MNKYELAVVVSAKIEDDERAATLEKAKALVERFGGQITNVDDWGKKKLAYEIQKMKEAYYYFIQFEAALRPRSRAVSASWITSSDICASDKTRNRKRFI